ncbi:hypothetical protein O6H91_Y062400 [Diphasiastrum complanatum]|nr:hypothetical protein O6H91_Y062400 [Diphasiastrum complanatum]
MVTFTVKMLSIHMQETKSKKKLSDAGHLDEMESGTAEASQICNHSFVCRNVVGLVCEECGLVGQWIENMFDNPNMCRASSRGLSRISKNRRVSHEFSSLSLRKESLVPQPYPRPTLKLHPFFKETMHAHQKEGFEFLCRNLIGSSESEEEFTEPGGCILAHAPGTGKTCLIVSFLQSFLTKFPQGRPLIIAPKIILQPWLREFKKWEVEETAVYNLNEESQTGRLYTDEPNSRPSETLPWPSRPGEAPKNSRLKTVQEWFHGKGVLLVSYSLFAGLVFNGSSSQGSSADKEICRMLLEGPGILILDEGHFPRNERTKILKALTQVQTVRRVLLSGTLFQNNFQELFNLLKLSRPNFMERCPEYAQKLEAAALQISNGVSTSVENIDLLELETNSSKSRARLEKHIFMEEIAHNITEIGDNQADVGEMCKSIQKLRHLTAPFIHWYGGQILDCLPGLQEFAIMLKLTESQRKALSNMKEERGSKTRLEQDIRFSAVCIHPVLLKSEVAEDCESVPKSRMDFRCSNHDPLHGVKTTFVLDLLNFCKHWDEKVIIFSQTLSPLDLIESMLENVWGWRKGHQMLRLDGVMPSDERQNVIDSFNSDKNCSHVLLASLKACGEGISLVGASRIILLDAAWNPAVIRQAVSRAFRIGQQKLVYVYRLITVETREVTIYTKSIWKEWLSRALLDNKVSVDNVVKMMSLPEQLASSVFGNTGDTFLETITQQRKEIFWGVFKHNMA